MEFLLDTADLAAIKKYADLYPLAGVTTNPSIIKKAAPRDFFAHLKEIRAIIGIESQLHAQVTGSTCDEMLDDAAALLAHVDNSMYIKVPVNEQGLKAIKILKRNGVRVTATAIYSKMQGFLATAAGADYLAPYFNRMQNLDVDPVSVISAFAEMIARSGADTRVVAASFKNAGQICEAFLAGADAVTLQPDIFDASVETAAVKKAVADFQGDWRTLYGETLIKDMK